VKRRIFHDRRVVIHNIASIVLEILREKIRANGMGKKLSAAFSSSGDKCQ
jgi:hypothetical protein